MSYVDNASVGEFSVDLPVFSGPFRLLADLLTSHKMDVCDVRVATVTEGFLAKNLGGRYEPIGDDFKDSTITVPAGAEQVPGVKDSLKK